MTDSASNTATCTLPLAVFSPISITTASLPAGTVGVAYTSTTLAATGGSGSYTWSATGLPAGLSINSTGTISGTPTTATGSPFSVQVTATDTVSYTGNSGSKSYSLTVSVPTITLSPASLPNGISSASYSQSITASGGTPSYTYSVTTGSLPAGLSLSSSGTLSGTITAAAGTYSFTVQAKDSYNSTGLQAYTMTVYPALSLTASGSSLPDGTVDASYSAGITQCVTASGGTETGYTYSIISGLPNGLSFNSTNNEIAGTPTAAGTSTLTVKVTDSRERYSYLHALTKSELDHHQPERDISNRSLRRRRDLECHPYCRWLTRERRDRQLQPQWYFRGDWHNQYLGSRHAVQRKPGWHRFRHTKRIYWSELCRRHQSCRQQRHRHSGRKPGQSDRDRR